MNINSEYIQKKEFHTVFKGYSMEEVDKFLDILAVEFDRLIKKNKELQDSLDKMRFENPSQDGEVSKLVSEVLVSAHKVADEIKKKAEMEAKEMIEQKKVIEELEINKLIERKNTIDNQLEQAQTIYKDFMIGMKSSLNELNVKIGDIEKNFKEKPVIQVLDEGIYVHSKKDELKTSELQVENTEKLENNDDSYIKKENDIPQSEEQSKTIEFEEDKKIRDFIEGGNIEDEDKNNINGNLDKFSDVKTGKKIFDEFEEDEIHKDKRKTDIGNPDIIDEFFGNNEERKY